MAVLKKRQAYQSATEIAAFAALLAREGVTSFLEIGSKYGGSLDVVARALPVGSRVVSVDLNRNGHRLGDCILALRRDGYRATLIAGDSRDRKTVDEVGKLAPFGAVFIDADHRTEAVLEDWKNYGPMAPVIAFHDVAWQRPPEWQGPRNGAPEAWRAIRRGHRFIEISHDTKGDYGIGVLWRS